VKAKGSSRLLSTFPVGAIVRADSRALSDAELFIPLAGGEVACSRDPSQAITWLIEAEGWEEGRLAQSLLAVGLQKGRRTDAVAFIGTVDPLSAAVAEELFDDRVRKFADLAIAVRNLRTPLAGFIGAGILLHDNRSAALFSSLLENERVASASCVLIHAEKRGKSWYPAIVAGSASTGETSDFARSEHTRSVEQLWRANYPVAAPPGVLWVAQSRSLTSWIEEQRPLEAEAVHVCSSLITASYTSECAATQSAPFIPAASEDRVIKVGALFG
jgi:hypothetical protein